MAGPNKKINNAVMASRRSFIKNIGAASAVAGAGLTVGSSFASEPLKAGEGDYDVIVVGSGFAGITAARDASQAGLRVLHLEGSNRLGGRTFTSKFAHHDVDLGGTWFGWGQPNVWAEKLKYDVPIVESAAYSASKCIWFDEKDKRHSGDPGEYWGIMTEANNKFYAPAREAIPRPYDPLFVNDAQGLDKITAEDAINQLEITPVQRHLLHGFAAINGHNYSSTTSYLDQLRWIAFGGYDQFFMWDNLGRFRFEGGTKSLLEKIHGDSKADFMFGQPVVKVKQSADKVSVTTMRKQTFTAKKLILAIPLNGWDRIDFSPSISQAKKQVSRDRHTGSGVKVYARIKGKHPRIFGHGGQNMPLTFLWTEYDDEDSQIVVGFGVSPDNLDTANETAVTAAVQSFIPGAEVIESVSYNWNVDPFALGTWCMYRPGVLTQHLRELQRPEGNIYMATSDIANGWRGFIDGAIESGASAAHQIINQLKQKNEKV
ncbi:flavin monoamine oxidase family protein [Neptunomonas sp.]|uniref:flavin monoamine oxidase family protein n=1 Tax=Neptunomonas sp. TaxID=1971898 RepID=UPI00356437BB